MRNVIYTVLSYIASIFMLIILILVITSDMKKVYTYINSDRVIATVVDKDDDIRISNHMGMPIILLQCSYTISYTVNGELQTDTIIDNSNKFELNEYTEIRYIMDNGKPTIINKSCIYNLVWLYMTVIGCVVFCIITFSASSRD